MPVAGSVTARTGLATHPQGTPASGGDGCRRIAPLLVRHCRAEARRSACLHSTSPETTTCAASLARVRDLRADLRGARNRFAADVENDVADLEAVIGGDAVRVDGGDDHAAAIRACDLAPGRGSFSPSFGTSLSGTSFSFCWFAACFSFGSVPSVSVMVLS